MRLLDLLGRPRSIKTMIIVEILGVITLFVIAWAAMSRAECYWYGYQTERQVRFGALVGCMVELDGKWYPRNELRVVQ